VWVILFYYITVLNIIVCIYKKKILKTKYLGLLPSLRSVSPIRLVLNSFLDPFFIALTFKRGKNITNENSNLIFDMLFKVLNLLSPTSDDSSSSSFLPIYPHPSLLTFPPYEDVGLLNTSSTTDVSSVSSSSSSSLPFPFVVDLSPWLFSLFIGVILCPVALYLNSLKKQKGKKGAVARVFFATWQV
jgi:hypothetical protein